MAFKRLSRVQASEKGTMVHGVVTKVSGTKLHVMLDDGRNVSAPTAIFQPSNEPFPKDSSFAKAITKKGTRVIIKDHDAEIEGVVIKGDILSANVLDLGNRSLEHKVPQSYLSLSEKQVPDPDEKTEMDRWSLSGYKLHASMSQETPAIEADILYDGKKVLSTINNGNGGCNMYYGSRDMQDKLEKDAREWCEKFGYKKPFEAADLWVSWAGEFKPLGLTAGEYIPGFAKEIGAYEGEEDASAPKV